MGFASAVIAYLHMLITALSSQELGRYRTVKAGASVFQLFVHAKPSSARGLHGHTKSAFCLLTLSSGYPHLVFTESDMWLLEQASSIAVDEIFLVSSFPNLISTLKAISMLLLLPCSFYNISVGQMSMLSWRWQLLLLAGWEMLAALSTGLCCLLQTWARQGWQIALDWISVKFLKQDE